MTAMGGDKGDGIIYEFNPIPTVGANPYQYYPLYSFTHKTGDEPHGYLYPLNSVLYGMTRQGGIGGTLPDGYPGGGVVFSYDLNTNSYTAIYYFGATANDGTNSDHGGLIYINGFFYGLTTYGGLNAHSGSYGGVIFRFNPNDPAATYQIVHEFGNSTGDGLGPHGSLILHDGLLFGMCYAGGASGDGTVFSLNPFSAIPGNTYQQLYSFTGSPADGQNPLDNVLFLDTIMFGLTKFGGAGEEGTLFSIGNEIVSKADLLGSKILAEDPPETGDSAFIQGLYADVLNRAPSFGEINGWLSYLQSGGTHAALADAFWTSAEHRTLEVDRLYLQILHRPADASGEAGWVNALLEGATETDVARAFLTSAEYAASHASLESFASGLYLDVLQRPGDPTGLASLEQALQSGLSRAAAATAILQSPEHLALVIDSLYVDLLGRTADFTGLSSAMAALGSRVAEEQVAVGILASDEYYNRATARF
jgi:uncharacterized repeat protein (TIGR03803 family)